MNIPFYRFVEYLDDGHNVYQCLKCGKEIDVGGWQFAPNFCCYCGIRYEGFILPKNKDWVYAKNSRQEKNTYVIQEAYEWHTDIIKEFSDRWSDTWRKNINPIEAFKMLVNARKEKLEQNKRDNNGKTIFRIVIKKEKVYNPCISIDTNKYFQRTGKKFNRNKY